MPNISQPAFRERKNPDGSLRYYCVKWGGREHVLGRDRDTAWKAYLQELDRWQQWRTQKEAARQVRPAKSPMVIDIVEQFLDAKRTEGGQDVATYYAKHLRRFLDQNGDAQADSIRGAHLQALKLDMLEAEYGRKTVNHDLTAVRGMLQWAMDMELIPPVNLRAAKNLSLGPVKSKAVSPAAVRLMVWGSPDPVRSWLAVNYLTAARPVEMIRLVRREGDWIMRGVFRLDRGKMDARAPIHRHIIVSPLAMKWLERCEPRWSRLDSYSNAVRAVAPVAPGSQGGPHILRHSAATHLRALGASSADVELILGHVRGRLSVTYAEIPWRALRLTAHLLRL